MAGSTLSGGTASNGRSTPDATNAVFLILFGVFLVLALLPVLVDALWRLLWLVVSIACIAVATNPSDQSFAQWLLRQQEKEVSTPSNQSVSQWFSSVIQTAISAVKDEPPTWQYHNVFLFTVVQVPILQRDAIGIFGTWYWADSNPYLKKLSTAPFVKKVSRGGVTSGLRRYTVIESGSRPEVRSKSESYSGLTESASGDSKRLRAKATKAKVEGAWKDAAKLFQDAAADAASVFTKSDYELQSAYCMVEDSDKFPTQSSAPYHKVQDTCEQLASNGHFHEAAQGLAEFGRRLRHKFKEENVATEIANLYIQAKDVAEAGGRMRDAIAFGVQAGEIYAEVSKWTDAQTQFEQAGYLQLREKYVESLDDTFGNAALCRFALKDVTGAKKLVERYADRVDSKALSREMTNLLEKALQAYERWQPEDIDVACRGFEVRNKLKQWQWQCLRNFQRAIAQGDLR